MAAEVSSYVSREGRLLILFVFSAAVVALLVVGLPAGLSLLVLGALLIWMYRDPERDVPASPLAVVSPVDGRVIAVALADDPYLQRKCQRVTIQMPLTGPFTTRSPIEGKVAQCWIGAGRSAAGSPFYAAAGAPDRAVQPHDRVALSMQTDEADDVVMTVVPRRFGFAPRCYIHVGQRVGQGQRCGFIPFGARVELLLPESARLLVSAGDTLMAGSDVIANVIHDARNGTQAAGRPSGTGVENGAQSGHAA